MSVILWAQLLLGITTVAGGITKWLRPRKFFVSFGCVNAVTAAALLVWYSGSDWGDYVMIAFAFILAGTLSSVPRSGWRKARWVILLGVCTIVGLSGLQLFYDDASAVMQTVLLTVTTLVAAAFVGMMLVIAAHIGRTRQDSDEQSGSTESI